MIFFTMESALNVCLELFEDGKYQTCMKKLVDIQLEDFTIQCSDSCKDIHIDTGSTSPVDQGSKSRLLLSPIIENNRTICDMYKRMKVNLNIRDELKAYEKCIEQLENQLIKCRSLPPKLNLLPVELITLNNVILLHVQSARLRSPGNLSKIFRELSRTLFRVSNSIHSPLPLHNILENDEPAVFVDTAEICINGLLCHYSADGCAVIHYIQQLVCSVILFLLMSDEDDNVESLLDIIDIHEVPDIHKGDMSIYRYAFTGGCNSDHQKLLPQLISLLHGYSYILKDDFENALVYLKRIQHEDWRSIASYLMGSLYLSRKQYQAVLDVLEDLMEHQDMKIDNTFKAQLLNLQGLCLSELDKGHWSVQKFKEAARSDCNYLPSLFNLSLQYKKQALYEEELEVLNQIVALLESGGNLTKSYVPKDVDITSILKEILVESGNHRIFLCQALYRLAKRHLELSRFDVAAQKYLHLINFLNDNKQLETDPAGPKLPNIQQIYHETVRTLLYAEKYNDSIRISEKALMCFNKFGVDTSVNESLLGSFNESAVFSQSYTQQHLSQCLSTQPQRLNSKKRMRSSSFSVLGNESFDEVGLLSGLDEDVTVLILKGQAHAKLKDYKSGSECLKRAQTCLQKKLGDTSLEYEIEKSSERYTKRRRTASDGTHTTVVNNEKSRLLKLLSEALIKLAEISVEQENYEDALHYLRSCVQVPTENLQAMYMLSNLLIELDFEQEGVQSWLDYRGIDYSGDSFQLGTELGRKQDTLRSFSEVDNDSRLDTSCVPEQKLLALDITCLENIMKVRNQQRLHR